MLQQREVVRTSGFSKEQKSSSFKPRIDLGFSHNSREFAAFALNPLLAQMARLSSSCPVLNEAGHEPEAFGGSLGSSPLHQPPSRKGSGKCFLIDAL